MTWQVLTMNEIAILLLNVFTSRDYTKFHGVSN